MLVELKDTSDKLFMLNPDHIIEFNRIENTDNYEIKTQVGVRTIDAAMAIYLHSSPTLSLSIVKLDSDYLEKCKLQTKASTMFPALNPRIEVVQPTNNVLFKGDTHQVQYTVHDSSATPTFSSSNDSIATVTSSGLVTVKGMGIVTIMASIGGVPGAVVLNCSSVDITVTPTTKTTFVDSGQFTVNSNSLVNDKPVWSSSNTNIATVSADGLVSIVKFGQADIKATVRDEVAICRLVVEEPGITVSQSTVSLQRGQSTTVSATVTNLENKTVVWTSDNDSIATVENGVINAVGSGRATIKASSSHGYANVIVDVEAIVITAEATKTMIEGTSSTWTANVSGTNLKANYISSNVEVATIDPTTGAITANIPGETTLTATVLDVTKSCTLSVEAETAPPEPPVE